MNPLAEAFKNYKGGEGFDSNPYPHGSRDYITYQEEINRLLTQELKEIRAEMRAGL